MQADTTFWDSLVFDGINDVDVEEVTAAFGTVDIVARGRAAGAACPDCGRFSDRVHDSYQRGLKDLPLAGQRVVIHLTVRRFICGTADCPRRTFAEPFARLTAPYARFTTGSSLNPEVEVNAVSGGDASIRAWSSEGGSVSVQARHHRVRVTAGGEPGPDGA
ncbi:transposase family protein [Streptomyces sp. NBC_00365]|uniref:transposase family protein n=1 Tax=Streptomyces sp. NBC_00365 TaxID=2975726 RepID=UPI002251CB1E|nr:transposase family protein [Streptomyces sp. NBC_00365]MCX5097269.1 transposase family protein [Streptomyces sp. NBC_00365]